jgi:hypothetical protein
MQAGAQKRFASPGRHPSERSPKLTVQEKLNVAQVEAEAAAAEAEATKLAEGLRATGKLTQGTSKATDRSTAPGSKMVKRSKISGRPKRRKSTLTPEELENLMFVN